MYNLSGRSMGRYQLVEQLGSGGMAAVYKAYDTRLDRYVAVKIILPQRQDSNLFLKRFEREAKSLAKLVHTNIVHVIDYGEQDGTPYLVMEYLSGGTLKQRMGKPLPAWEAARLLLPIAQALEYAHQHKIIHRDVKPANILLSDSGQPLLSDFGIAKVFETDMVSLTETGMGIGTPEYIAPEQGMGKEGIDQRVDIYSLGVIFYELVTGRRPFSGNTPVQIIMKHATEPLPNPRKFVPDLPETALLLINQSLAKEPGDRLGNMKMFADALEKIARSQQKIAPVKTVLLAPSESLSTTNIHGGTKPSLDTIARPVRPGQPTSYTRSWRGILLAGSAILLLVIAGVASIFIFVVLPAITRAAAQNTPTLNPTSPAVALVEPSLTPSLIETHATPTPTEEEGLSESSSTPVEQSLPTQTRTSQPSRTRTPAETAKATPYPGWVKKFAEPILTAIKDAPPFLTDDFSVDNPRWMADIYSEGSQNSQNFPAPQWIEDGAFKITVEKGQGLINVTHRDAVKYAFVMSLHLQFGAAGCCKFSIDCGGYDPTMEMFFWNDNGKWHWRASNGQEGTFSTRTSDRFDMTIIKAVDEMAVYVDGEPAAYVNIPGSYGTSNLFVILKTQPISYPVNANSYIKLDDYKFWDLRKIPGVIP